MSLNLDKLASFKNSKLQNSAMSSNANHQHPQHEQINQQQRQHYNPSSPVDLNRPHSTYQLQPNHDPQYAEFLKFQEFRRRQQNTQSLTAGGGISNQ